MGSCTSLIPNQARTRSRANSTTFDGDDGYPQPIDIHEKYSFVDGVLEEGATGHVVKGFEKNNKSNEVAIKIMPKSSNHGYETAKSLFENEVNILRSIKHQNIVQLRDIAEDETNYYVILNLGKGGDLVEYIFDDDVHINEGEAASWTRIMLETLKYLHNKNIVHCDLKPENIVFKSHRGCDEILLIDFGLAKIVNDDCIYNDLCANKYYTAPEIAEHYLNLENRERIQHRRTNSVELSGKIWKSTDIWSVGIISYIMVLKTLPFFSPTDKGTFQRIVKDPLKLPRIDSDTHSVSQDFRDFISKILHKDPHKRLGIHQALRHPWIRRCVASLDVDVEEEAITFVRRECRVKRMDRNKDGVLDKILMGIDVEDDATIDFNEFKRLWRKKIPWNEDIKRLFRDHEFGEHSNGIEEYPSKDLIYGYIRNVLLYGSSNSDIWTVIEGNLYFNCALKSHESSMRVNKVINDVPSLVINTIYRNLYNLSDKNIVLDGRTHTI